MEAAADISAEVHPFAVTVDGLTTGSLLHRSKHADTVHASWRGAAVVAKRIREDIVDADERASAGRGILREGLLLQRIEHPNVVRVTQLVDEPATLVLELCPGRSMREELKQRRRVPTAEAARIATQLADALDHLHRRHILHRDVKPANIMYDGSRAMLIDFHLAKVPGPMRGGAGTRLFAAPEQVIGGHVTGAADVWGLGTVLYRAVTGRLPFHADSGHPQLELRPTPALERLASSRYEGDLDRASLALDPRLADLVDQMLSYDPHARPKPQHVIRACAGLLAASA